MSAPLPTRGPVAPILLFALVVGACTSSTTQGTPTGGAAPSDSSASSLTIPLPAPDPEAFRLAEAALRRDGRERAGLAKVGPGALELATLMDQTASFLLAQVPAKMRALVPPGGQVVSANAVPSGFGSRLAAPLRDFPSPGDLIVGTYAMTTVVFPMLVADQTGAPSTSTVSETFRPTTDEVTIQGNKGKIFTTMSASVTINGSKVSLDIKMKVEGEVRDAKTGALLFKIANEGTGHAEGDACPDPSGTAHASMSFTGHEDYFDSNGAKVGTGVAEGFSGQLRIKADENAKLAGIDITTTGTIGEPLIRMAAASAAPAFEKAWRSGLCIVVLVSPDGGDIEKDSVTTVTVKAMHRFEGKELDKPLDVSFSGVKAIDPPPSKQKVPVSLRYTAGPKDGDRGSISVESISNRGIGKKSVTFIVGGGWTIRSEGTYSEVLTATGNAGTHATVSLNAIRVKVGKDNTLSGSGTITIKGTYTFVIADFLCSGPIDKTMPATVTGILGGVPAGTASDGSRPAEIPVFKLTIDVPTPPGEMISLTCTDSPALSVPYPGIGSRYALTLGELEIFALDGARKSFNRSVPGNPEYRATANVTLVTGVP